MKIQTVKPCSGTDNKVVVRCEIGKSLDLRNLCRRLESKEIFTNLVLFESSNMLWLSRDLKSITVSGQGEITIHTADDIDDAMSVVRDILDVIKGE